LIAEPSTDEAHRKAKEAYEAAPTDVNCAVTYAFALYGLGRTTPALEVLRTLPPDRLLEPHSAVYVAVIYLDENQVDAAKPYIAAANDGPIYPRRKSCSKKRSRSPLRFRPCQRRVRLSHQPRRRPLPRRPAGANADRFANTNASPHSRADTDRSAPTRGAIPATVVASSASMPLL
jgi:hypothetical protein